jgi:hypothetical protein
MFFQNFVAPNYPTTLNHFEMAGNSLPLSFRLNENLMRNDNSTKFQLA